MLLQFQEGLIVIDHHSPITEDLSPKPGVRGFSCTAVCGEEISLAIYSQGASMKQQDIKIKEIFGKSSLNSSPLQERICKDPGLKAIPVGLCQQICLLKVDMFTGNGDGKLRRAVR